MKNLELIDTLTSSIEDVKKFVFKDEDVLEVSYIRKNDGKDIICVPSQTSCAMGCSFCHLTGNNIKTKNLSSERIVNLIVESLKIQPPANETLLISYMNSGEPFMNLDGLLGSALTLRDHCSYENLRKNYKTLRFAVSTILPGESRFQMFKNSVKQHKLNFKLHWSLHSLDQITRKSLMPAASDIQKSLNMIDEFIEETNQPAEIHYTLIDGINDRDEDLASFIKYVGKKATIKFLKFSEKKGDPMKGSLRVDWFKKELENNGFTVEVYDPPGRDISSSCGQFIVDQYTK